MASLARTILEDHLDRGELVPGQEIALRVDQTLAQDATGTMAMMRFAKPGQTLVGADSHTTQSGSCAMIAIGAGGLDVAVCMAGHPFELPCPKIVGVHLENELRRPWIQAKDVILELLRRRGVRGGRGCIFEFFGPGVSSLSYTARGTIANMIAELGATGAVFPADGETLRWLDEQQLGD